MAESAITTEDMLPDLPPSSDEDDTESLPNGTRPVCFIGISENDICDYFSTRGKRLSPDVYNNCVEDVLPYLSSFFPSAAAAACPNSNEQWLIRNRFGGDIHGDAYLCGKHRSKYGIGFKSSKCCYPEHVITESSKRKKRKASSNDLRVILASQLKAINLLHSSPLHQLHLPVGSVWCNNCRLRLYPDAKKEYVEDKSVCEVCGLIHASSTTPFETPRKRSKITEDSVSYSSNNVLDTPCSQVSCTSQDSQEYYTPDGIEKDNFNTTLSSLDVTWSPLKHQVRTSMDLLNPKTKNNVVNKATKAIDVVLEQIAPGQGETLKEEIFKKYTELDIPRQIKDAVLSANGNVRIQLLSLVAGAKEEGKYVYTINDLMTMFPGVSKYYVEMARAHAKDGKVGLPITPGKYTRKKLKDSQIHHFLDFLQYSKLVQDVASGTRNVTLSTGRKATMPNVVRTVHKAEIVRLYEAACEEEGYQDKPSTRTLWNILEKCPASQRKSLAGLDNVAAEGSDSFDALIQLSTKIGSKCPELKETMEDLQKALIRGKRYLKGDYKSHCKSKTSEIADHCRAYALSDPKVKEFQEKCDHEHKKKCASCEELKKVLKDLRGIDLSLSAFDAKEKGIVCYDIQQNCSRIETWKAHILTVIHQDSHKYDILRTLDEQTSMIIIDYAMKFLSCRYRESMAKWFGKSGNGMHVMCVVYKVADTYRKRTYINFTGKSSQDVGSVMAIYESCLQQIRVDLPQISKIVDKSDNAGCYHTEVLFTWKSIWAKEHTGHQFVETIFNERQAGKDQCDRDSATAKRQMNFYLNSGHNIENAEEMNAALRAATAICGFSSCVMKIEKSTSINPENIKSVSKIHHIKYVDSMFHVWQYYGIGKGKKYPVGALSPTPTYAITVPFERNHSFGNVMVETRKRKETIFCAESMCSKSFNSVDDMLHHLDYEEHTYVGSKTVTQMSRVSDAWVQRFAVEGAESSEHQDIADESLTSLTGVCDLPMGWAIPVRTTRRLTNVQKKFLNRLFDEGETTGSKVTAEDADGLMREEFDSVDHFLPLSTIKSYFSRRKVAIRDGKSQIGEVLPVEDIQLEGVKEQTEEGDDVEDPDIDDMDEYDEGNDEVEEERCTAVKRILSLTENFPDLHKDDWIAVALGDAWFPGQFCQFDSILEELEINFMHRSSSNDMWFVWPALQPNGVEDKSWVKEELVFYRLDTPKEGRRETLFFAEHNNVEVAFKDMKNKKNFRS